MVTARAKHGVRLGDGKEKGETRGRGHDPPLIVDHLVKISAVCPDNLRDIRDRALVLMHFAVAGFQHELALQPGPRLGGIKADLRVSKVRAPWRPGPLRLPALDLPEEGLTGVEGGRRPHRPGRLRLPSPAQPLEHRDGGRRTAARVHR
ncbi:hypothetical protein GCM10010228_35560 [Streptomyces massasporeus]|nr:hypothetical protein GCM10010228_35560 [Streptomyces massasporeus]